MKVKKIRIGYIAILSFMLMALLITPSLAAKRAIDYVTISAELMEDCCIEFVVTIPASYNSDTLRVEIDRLDSQGYPQETVVDTLLYVGVFESFIYCPPDPASIGIFYWGAWFTGGSGENAQSPAYQIDMTQCCSCPDDKSAWIALTMDSESENCGPGQCEVIPSLNVPEYQIDSCYHFYNCKTATSGFEQQNYSINDPLPTYCISNGEILDFELVLMKYSTDDPSDPQFDHCILRDSIGPCEMNDGEPCYPDYPEVEFNNGEPFTFTMGPDSPCPGCVVSVDYVYRNILIRQDLQITGMYFDENGPCAGCTIEDIYEQALPQAMLECIDNHQFLPNQVNGINSQWRVSQAGCWGKKVVEEEFRIYTKWEPCGCDTCGCCLHRFEVQMIDGETLDITPIGTPIVFDSQCDSTFIEYSYNDIRPCEAACEWPGLVNGEYVRLGEIQTGKITYGQNEILHEMSFSFLNDELNVELHTIGADNVEINIYDLNGTIVGKQRYDVHRGINNLVFDTSKLISGTYLFTVTIDGRVTPAEKLVIVR